MKTAMLAMVVVAAACAGSFGPEISDARVGEPTGPNAALYFTATGNGDGDRLVAATTDVAESTEMHETAVGDDGTVGMRSIESLDLPTEGTLVLEPGGHHVMLVDVDRLEVGEVIEVVLVWENAGEMTVMAEVVDPADTVSAP